MHDVDLSYGEFEWLGGEPGLEAVIGERNLQHPWFLSKGTVKCRSVGCIPRNGTGFLITPEILLTNHHLFREPQYAEGLSVLFGYETDEDGIERPHDTYALRPDLLFKANGRYDYAAVYVSGQPGKKWGYLDPAVPFRLRVNDRVNIVQHPGAEWKQVALRDNHVTYIDEVAVHYVVDTERGSSGSPVFDDKWNVVALHRKYYRLEGTRFYRNLGTRIDRIWTELKSLL